MRFGKAKEEQPVEDERIGTWADSGYDASDEEAHRNVRYEGSSPVKRILWIFMAQMKLFSKNKWTFILLFMAVLMPIVIIVVPDLKDATKTICAGSTAYIGTLLCMITFMASFFTSFLCGTQIPNEFKDRTAYMSMPLPVTRMEFYIGKYLAGFVLCVGAFLMAFGFAVILAMMEYDTFFSDEIASALLGTIVTIFAFSATAYCLGSFMKRGSALVPLIFMFFLLPIVCFLAYMRLDLDAMLLFPCFLPDNIIFTLGSEAAMSIGGMSIGMFGVDLPSVANIDASMLVSIVWGIAFLILGAYKMSRREM